MKKINKKLTIIKYGSNTLVNEGINGLLSIDYSNINNHGFLINEIQNPVIIISSGAVAFGKTMRNELSYITDDIIRKRIFSAIGNPYLSINWDKAISDKLILQSLITHRDLISEDSRGKISKIISELYQKDDAIIQVNDNDFITDEELTTIRGGDFGDNDKITALLAELCNEIFDEVEVIVNTGSDGVLENSEILPEIKTENLKDDYIEKICTLGDTTAGTGGMSNKLKIFRDLIEKNNKIKVYIINGKKPEDLKSLLNKGEIGTKIFY